MVLMALYVCSNCDHVWVRKQLSARVEIALGVKQLGARMEIALNWAGGER